MNFRPEGVRATEVYAVSRINGSLLLSNPVEAFARVGGDIGI